MGVPRVERSVPPGFAPPTLRMTRRTARPMAALARFPWPSAPRRMFMPMWWRMGPFTTIAGAAPIVVAQTPWALNSSLTQASMAVMTTGRYSGLQPAMTALMATFSTVAGAMFGGTTATRSCASRVVPSSIRITRSGVGGTTGRPSVRPWSKRNSCRSSPMPTSMRRARRGLPSASAASRSAMPGSTEREPQPGRESG